MSGGPVTRTDAYKVVGVTSEKYLFQDAGRAWRMTLDVFNLIASLR